MIELVMSVEQVGEALGCSRRRVFELLKDGTLERAPRFGRAIRIYRAGVERALTPRTQVARRRNTPVVGVLDLSKLPPRR